VKITEWNCQSLFERAGKRENGTGNIIEGVKLGLNLVNNFTERLCIQWT
jgi:hypothetical protein